MKPSRFDRIWMMKTRKGDRLFTESLYPFRGFEETILKKDGKKFREVNPERSKLFAGISKGLSQIGLREGSSVLYLGASHGYTPSFVSDVVGENGCVICVDVAPRVVRDLVFVCQRRVNMAPVLADCKKPETYREFVPQRVDVIFQDIAQRDQIEIFLRNIELYLKPGGFGIIAIKARSIDVSKNPQVIFKESFERLNRISSLVIVDKRELAPLEKDHILFVVKKK